MRIRAGIVLIKDKKVALIERFGGDRVKSTPAEIQKYLETIQETPRVIASLTASIHVSILENKADANSWSANEILAHLRSCADLWTHSIYAMLAENQPVLADINERKWAKAAHYAHVPFAESFEAFSLQRANLVRVLRALPLESWERSALIVERKHTIFTQVRRMAKHEKEHCEQLAGLLEGGV